MHKLRKFFYDNKSKIIKISSFVIFSIIILTISVLITPIAICPNKDFKIFLIFSISFSILSVRHHITFFAKSPVFSKVTRFYFFLYI